MTFALIVNNIPIIRCTN